MSGKGKRSREDTKVVVASRAKKAKKSPEPETRGARFRSSCPKSLAERMDRALSQRLYLVQRQMDESNEIPVSCEFNVLGSTGNVYTVTIAKTPSCNCPDFAKRGDLCKHLIFVLVKVIGIRKDDPLAFQKAYVSSELQEIFGRVLNRPELGGEGVMANARVRLSYAKLQDESGEASEKKEEGTKRRALVEGESDCPICFDPMKEGGKGSGSAALVYCKAACGSNFHSDCIRRWTALQREATCPNCRQPWISRVTKAKTGEEGYVNLASQQGQSRKRNTSTYHRHFFWKGRF